MKYVISFISLIFVVGCGNGGVIWTPHDPVQGPVGPRGTSCHVESAVNGAVILCEDGSSALITNGLNGVDGAAGSNGTNGTNGTNGLDTNATYSIVEIVDPCGTNPSIHNEVFFRLGSGVLVASFSDNINGYNTRFSVLSPGSYMTSDGDNCTFTVDSNNHITNENHHF